MAIKVQCGTCDKALSAPTSAAGRVLACPGCKGEIRVPSLLDDESPIGLNPDSLWDAIAQEMPELSAAPAAVTLAPTKTHYNKKQPALLRFIRDPLTIAAAVLITVVVGIVAGVFWVRSAWHDSFVRFAKDIHADAEHLGTQGHLRESYDAYGNLIDHLGGAPSNPELSVMWERANAERDRIWPLIKADIEREELEKLASAAASEHEKQRAKAARQAARLNEEREERLQAAQREARPKVIAAIEGWLKAQKLGESGDNFWSGTSTRTKLYALREYEVLSVELDFKFGNVVVRASYSSEEGQPIIRVWNFRLEPNTAGDWRIVSMTPQI